MDLNLHLLESSQLKLIQDICKAKGALDGYPFDGFEKVRDKIDLIILDYTTGYGKYKSLLDADEEYIRIQIGEEQNARENGQMPHLPNYESPYDDPIWPSWDPPKLDSQIEDFLHWKKGCGKEIKLSTAAKFVYENKEQRRAGRLTDSELMMLDLRLARIKWDRLRVKMNSILGCFTYDIYEKDKKIILFLDNIKKCAMLKKSSVDTVVGAVFIHEMFHAYFDDTTAKEFIQASRNTVNEIEEAMTECSTLLFIKNHFNGLLKYAEEEIESNFSSSCPTLHCYGLGYHLYKELERTQHIKDIFRKYKKIQRSPQMSNPIVSYYVSGINSPLPNKDVCVRTLLLILKFYDKLIKADMKHMEFDGKQYGWTSQLATAYLKYYVAYNRTVKLADIQTDFGPQYADFFEDITKADKKKYDFDVQIVLRDATIVPIDKWDNKSPKGNTSSFLKCAENIYRMHKIDQKIEILR